MKKINVIVKGKTILELTENAMKGDIIDLEELVQVDTSYLEAVIESQKDKAYQAKLDSEKQLIESEYGRAIDKLNYQIKALEKQNENNLKIKEQEIAKKYQEQILELINTNKTLEKEKETVKQLTEQTKDLKYMEYKLKQESLYQDLQAKYKNLEEKLDSKVKEKELEIDKKYQEQIKKLEKDYALLTVEKNNSEQQLKSSFDLTKEKEFHELKERYDAELKTKTDQILELQRQKSSLNVKLTGEDLEKWCDNEVQSYTQNGLFNCKWEKDNTKVKGEEDEKETKSDFILTIFADNKRKSDEVLTSICFEMKDENPESKTKQKNNKFYAKLNEDRNKKGCKYAVLVSNLEMDCSSSLPIFKVHEYEDMYVVRPAYLMTFINLMVSLTTKYGYLLLDKEKERIDLKEKIKMLDEFNKIKETYLDKPLQTLENEVEAITKSNASIKKAANDIDNACEKIKFNFISKISEKISKFELNA